MILDPGRVIENKRVTRTSIGNDTAAEQSLRNLIPEENKKVVGVR